MVKLLKTGGGYTVLTAPDLEIVPVVALVCEDHDTNDSAPAQPTNSIVIS